MSTAVSLLAKLVKWEIGLSDTAEDHQDIENLLYARWDRIHEITPAFVSAVKTPDHWEQGHSHVTFEITLLGYNTAITTEEIDTSANVAYDEDGDSYPMDYSRIFYQDKAHTEKYTDFNQAIIATVGMVFPQRGQGQVVAVIRGSAYYKTDG